MVARLPLNTRSGDLGEQFAQCVLSSLGIATQVPRQNDFGVDFHCGLVREKGNCVYVESSYLVQVKTTKDRTVTYGGYEKDKDQWRSFEIDWLFSQDNPLLLGFVDNATQSLGLYSTSIMWVLRYLKGGVGELQFIPDEPIAGDGFRDRERITDSRENSDGVAYDVPLGKPLVHLSVAQCEVRGLLSQARDILRVHNDFELKNIAYRRLGVHYSQWLPGYQTNGPVENYSGSGMWWNDARGANTDPQLKSMAPIVATLMSNYAAQGRREEVRALTGTAILILKSVHVAEYMEKRIRECIDWAGKGD